MILIIVMRSLLLGRISDHNYDNDNDYHEFDQSHGLSSSLVDSWSWLSFWWSWLIMIVVWSVIMAGMAAPLLYMPFNEIITEQFSGPSFSSSCWSTWLFPRFVPEFKRSLLSSSMRSRSGPSEKWSPWKKSLMAQLCSHKQHLATNQQISFNYDCQTSSTDRCGFLFLLLPSRASHVLWWRNPFVQGNHKMLKLWGRNGFDDHDDDDMVTMMTIVWWQ